jgi:hypothetical protein
MNNFKILKWLEVGSFTDLFKQFKFIFFDRHEHNQLPSDLQ